MTFTDTTTVNNTDETADPIYHSFRVTDAVKYGVPEATILQSIRFWCAQNRQANRNIHPVPTATILQSCRGWVAVEKPADYYVRPIAVLTRSWTFDSARALHQRHPYLPTGSIPRQLKKLVRMGVLYRGCFNRLGFDRTSWYALVEADGTEGAPICRNDKSIYQNDKWIRQNDKCIRQNDKSICRIDATIPDTNSDSNSVPNPDGEREETRSLAPTGGTGNQTTEKTDEQAGRALAAVLDDPFGFVRLLRSEFSARFAGSRQHAQSEQDLEDAKHLLAAKSWTAITLAAAIDQYCAALPSTPSKDQLTIRELAAEQRLTVAALSVPAPAMASPAQPAAPLSPPWVVETFKTMAKEIRHQELLPETWHQDDAVKFIEHLRRFNQLRESVVLAWTDYYLRTLDEGVRPSIKAMLKTWEEFRPICPREYAQAVPPPPEVVAKLKADKKLQSFKAVVTSATIEPDRLTGSWLQKFGADKTLRCWKTLREKTTPQEWTAVAAKVVERSAEMNRIVGQWNTEHPQQTFNFQFN